MKTAVIYWSGTGNTQAMAQCVCAGAKEVGAAAEAFSADEFSADKAAEYDSFAFGCPSMGDEELESAEFAPVFEACTDAIKGKKVALFGSYGWGDGQWMRDWEEDIEKKGAQLVGSVICCGEPDDDAQTQCKELGGKLG